MSIFIAYLAVLTVTIVHCNSQSCEITIKKELHDFAPLLLNSSSLEFIYPKNGSSSLLLNHGETLDLFCPGTNNHLNSTFGKMKNTRIICLNETLSLPESTKNISIKDIKCLRYPESSVRKNRLDTRLFYPDCENNLHTIGFLTPRNKFVKVIQVCFNQQTQSPVISHAVVSPFLNASQRSPRRRVKFNSAFMNSRVDKAYRIDNQQETFNKIFGSNLTQKYITKKTYLQRGHLMARADFYYQSQQVSSYYHLNAVPMWSVINGGNWALLENDVRQFSNSKGEHLDVWTGSFGVLELEDSFDTPRAVFLLDSEFLPIPKYLFKLVYEPLKRKAVVFVMINNPFMKTLPLRDIVCRDVIEKIDWVKHPNKPVILSKGMLYACNYHEFKQVFDKVPELVVDDLLT